MPSTDELRELLAAELFAPRGMSSRVGESTGGTAAQLRDDLAAQAATFSDPYGAVQGDALAAPGSLSSAILGTPLRS